jgi:predicted Rossmann fold nucleotide-binding protein DprA/Smf involved in DNA uptake
MIKEGLAKPWQLGRAPYLEESPTQKRVLDALREGAADFPSIARESGLSIEEVKKELFRLKLDA